jgi:ATP-dependent helicase/nuclease subunit B
MHRDLPRLEKPELFARLNRGHAAGITVLTPNRRLAQALIQDYDRLQSGAGLSAWETPDVLPFGAFVARLWEDALYSELAPRIPLLLSPAQEEALWEDCIGGTRHAAVLFSKAATAAQCRESWQVMHAWRIGLADAASEDARAFAEWSSCYARSTADAGQTDAARLADVVVPHLAHAALRKPATLVLYGFDLMTPQMRDLLTALGTQGCAIFAAAAPAHSAEVRRVEVTEARDEVLAAARWARAALEGGASRIGVVVPDLARSRARVHRIFSNVMGGAAPFDISLGVPLADCALAGDALIALAFAGHAIAFESASRLVRSPFIAGAEAEMAVRARLDARLRERCGPSVTLDALARLCASDSSPRAPVLLERLQRLVEFRKSTLAGKKAAPEWAKAFSDALRVLGFPGERTLDSVEHQALDKWHELLAEFATLERVTAKMDAREASRRLERMANDAIFQPESGDVPIRVMGVLESAGLEFDRLWVMGLTDEAWPLPARPAAFIPVRSQRAVGIPQADPVSSLELDRRITEGWMRSAPQVVFSHARMKGESELAVSPLVAPVELASLEAIVPGEYRSLRAAIHAAGRGRLETLEDARAPAIEAGPVHGGTRLFRDQAACPFRGFAHFRVESKPLEAPRPGLNPRDRGTLVHEMLAGVWKAIGTSERLAALRGDELELLLGKSADEAIAKVKRYRADVLSGRFAVLERERLVRMTREWLEVERQRPPFEVAEAEEKRPVTFGGVTVNARLDRMDRLASGGQFILDYKSGACKVAAWLGARPDEPQVPMYALGAADDVAGVAFAQVRTGEMAFKGIGRAPDLVPGVKTVDKDRVAKAHGNWDKVVARWRAELDAIGRGFAGGDARVDPKRGAATCDLCDQKMFCRIAEKAPFGAGAGVGGGESDE